MSVIEATFKPRSLSACRVAAPSLALCLALCLSACSPTQPDPVDARKASSQPAPSYPPVFTHEKASTPTPTPTRPSSETLRILVFNDFHGALEASPSPNKDAGRGEAEHLPPVGGLSALAESLWLAKQGSAHTLLLSIGDLTGASDLASAMEYDEPTIQLMNQLGLDANIVGNHELDHGYAELQRLIEGGCPPRAATAQSLRRLGQACANGPHPGANFPYLSANIRLQSDALRAVKQPAPHQNTALAPASSDQNWPLAFSPYLIKRYRLAGQELTVAVVGATVKNTPNMVPKAGIQGLSFADEARTLNQVATQLLRQTPAGSPPPILIAALHEGGRVSNPDGDPNACRGLRGDLVPIVQKLHPAYRIVLTAHTHASYRCELDGRIVTSAGAHGRYWTQIDVRVPTATEPASKGQSQGDAIRAENFPSLRQAVALPLNFTRQLDAVRSRHQQRAQQVVGRLSAPLTRVNQGPQPSSLGRAVADAMLAATQPAGADFALMNAGGLRADLEPDAEGRVRYGQIFAVLPFGNHLTTISLKGEVLNSFFKRMLDGGAQDRRRWPVMSSNLSYAAANPSDSAENAPRTVLYKGQKLEEKHDYKLTIPDFLLEISGPWALLRQYGERVDGGSDLEAFSAWLQQHSTKQ